MDPFPLKRICAASLKISICTSLTPVETASDKISSTTATTSPAISAITSSFTGLLSLALLLELILGKSSFGGVLSSALVTDFLRDSKSILGPLGSSFFSV